MRNYTFENQEAEKLAHSKLQEIHKNILDILAKIFQQKTKNQLQVTQKLILNIYSLESNIEKIEDSNIFMKNKNKRGGKLHYNQFLGI